LKGLSHGVDLEFHLSCFKKTHFQITWTQIQNTTRI
jgi:hypothetical protein